MNPSQKSEALARAKEHIFSMAPDDAAAQLCIANMTYGLAKIHFAQAHYGLPADATFIGTPDMTITRNSGRWKAGIGYGGKLSWGDGDRDMLVLDVKPNTCGMLVGGLHQEPEARSITRRLHDLHGRQTVMDGVTIAWDFGTGNHFVDVFRIAESDTETSVPPYVFVIHASAAELRSQSEHGPGLYWDSSDHWLQRADCLDTPWGPLHVLRGDAVAQYVDNYRSTEDFATRRRHLAGEDLFGPFELISNTNHQGLLNANEILLGCQSTRQTEAGLLPIMVRADRPAFLMHGKPNLTTEVLERLGFFTRAKELGVVERLLHADVIPHGAGYSLPHVSGVRQVFEIDGTRYFELVNPNQRDTQIVSEPKDLVCSYRDEQVVQRTVDCGLGTVAARLEPLFVLKT